jgi:hypothetical protein
VRVAHLLYPRIDIFFLLCLLGWQPVSSSSMRVWWVFFNHLHIQCVSGLWCKVQTLNFVWVVCNSALSSSSSDQLSGVATSSCFFPWPAHHQCGPPL